MGGEFPAIAGALDAAGGQPGVGLHDAVDAHLPGLDAALMIGSESAARRLGVPQDFTLVLVASLLICLGLGEFIDQRKRRKER